MAARTETLKNSRIILKNYARGGNNLKAAMIINSLNRINFQDKLVSIKLRHLWNNSFKTVAAKPAASDTDKIHLSWAETEKPLLGDLSAYEYSGLFYTDGLKMVRVRANLISMNTNGVTLSIPEGGEEIIARNYRRFECLDISAKISQGVNNLRGKMKDYNGVGFAIAFPPEQITTARKINTNMPINLVVTGKGVVLLEAICRIIRPSSFELGLTMIIKPVSSNIRRLKPKNFRGIRLQLVPQPYIEFDHPFIAKKISLKAIDISGAGICIEEDPATPLLMPGMLLPTAMIKFANNLKIDCKAQVLYNRSTKVGDAVQTGLLFTDMNCENQLQLSSILAQTKNARSYIGSSVDQNELWDFFFATGFVYPEKYKAMEEQQAKFKSLYSRIYRDCPDIARHAIYRDKGVIYGHLSMLRYYRRTWLIHHHAALKSSKHKAGLVVLEHLIQHINEVHHFTEAAMDYLACYFRPDNRFANRIFGGGLRSLQDPRKGSLDEFAYFHHKSNNSGVLPADWTIERSGSADFETLKSFYDEISGGLMLVGFDLTAKPTGDEAINSSYRGKNLLRERRLYSLKDEHKKLIAIFTLNFSDVGLNMSSLTNCIQVMVIDHKKAASEKILNALALLSDNFAGVVPVLLFPRSYADEHKMTYEKIYTLGVMDANYICEFLDFLTRLTKPSLRLAKDSPA